VRGESSAISHFAISVSDFEAANDCHKMEKISLNQEQPARDESAIGRVP